MVGCHGERSKESDRLVEFEPPNADEGTARLDHQEGVKVLRYARRRKPRDGEELRDRREVTWLRRSHHHPVRAA